MTRLQFFFKILEKERKNNNSDFPKLGEWWRVIFLTRKKKEKKKPSIILISSGKVNVTILVGWDDLSMKEEVDKVLIRKQNLTSDPAAIKSKDLMNAQKKSFLVDQTNHQGQCRPLP